MKKEIIAVVSVFILMVINTLFWHWYCWMFGVAPRDPTIAIIGFSNVTLMIFGTAYFSQKYSKD